MAMFGGNSDGTDKAQKILAKYGLENIDPQYAGAVQEIADELVGTGLSELGMKLGAGSEKNMLKQQVYYQNALIKQNFIMIRQLDQIAYMLEQISKK